MANQFVKFKGLHVTGIGSVACQHGFFCHAGTVDYFGGEQYVFTDYAVGSVLGQHQSLGSHKVFLVYDIFCFWNLHFEERITSYEGCVPVTAPFHLEGAVGKFHLLAHKEDCYILYSSNNIPEVGRTDGETLERLWSSLNEIAGSACEKGPGARQDQLNHHQNYSKLQKQTGLAKHLPVKYWEAKEMFLSTKHSWSHYSSDLRLSTMQQWEKMDITPKKESDTSSSLAEPEESPTKVVTSGSITDQLIYLEVLEHDMALLTQQYNKSQLPSLATQLNKKKQELNHKAHGLFAGYLTWLGLGLAASDIDTWHVEDAALQSPSQLSLTESLQVSNVALLKAQEKASCKAECLAALAALIMAGSI
ncbi:hypothetical protein FRC07_001824 [Ceratobasidium sp. 392]|nr:hypothetical protein FRC07_001824 [Ceratobasidium sp. 392]